MQFSGFDWDDGNLDKCQKHGMTIADIESVFRGVVVVFPDKPNPQGEDRMRAIGTTTAGRKAFIVYTWRHIGQNSRLIRPSARGSCTKRRWIIMKKPIPTFNSDEEAEDFIATVDLTDFDLSGGTVVHFELQPKDKSVNLRLPEPLLNAVRAQATRQGIPYQRFIRMALEKALHQAKS